MSYNSLFEKEAHKRIDMLPAKKDLEKYAVEQIAMLIDFEALCIDDIEKIYHILKQMHSESEIEIALRPLKFLKETYTDFSKRMKERGYRVL